uniref:Acid sensing ion channel subunit 1 n=1 Tax=Prolemur simus TaxID=1328070 RepID=A0A8C8YPY0_PROSS
MELKAEEEEVGGVQPVSIQAFASSSTLHGLAHIFSYERLSLKRALWALCFLGSLAVLLCVCTERVQYYFRYHHVTKLDEVAASQLTFPAVTLCNLNEFRFSQVSKNDLYHAGELLALLNNRYEIPDTQMADEKQLEILQDKANFRSFKPKPFNMREFYDRAGHDIRDMLLSCHFRGEVCSAEDFKVKPTLVAKELRRCTPLGSAFQGTALHSASPGLHTVRKVLHVQLRPRRAAAAEDHEGWDGQWAGNHAGHSAG